MIGLDKNIFLSLLLGSSLVTSSAGATFNPSETCAMALTLNAVESMSFEMVLSHLNGENHILANFYEIGVKSRPLKRQLDKMIRVIQNNQSNRADRMTSYFETVLRVNRIIEELISNDERFADQDPAFIGESLLNPIRKSVVGLVFSDLDSAQGRMMTFNEGQRISLEAFSKKSFVVRRENQPGVERARESESLAEFVVRGIENGLVGQFSFADHFLQPFLKSQFVSYYNARKGQLSDEEILLYLRTQHDIVKIYERLYESAGAMLRNSDYLQFYVDRYTDSLSYSFSQVFVQAIEQVGKKHLTELAIMFANLSKVKKMRDRLSPEDESNQYFISDDDAAYRFARVSGEALAMLKGDSSYSSLMKERPEIAAKIKELLKLWRSRI